VVPSEEDGAHSGHSYGWQFDTTAFPIEDKSKLQGVGVEESLASLLRGSVAIQAQLSLLLSNSDDDDTAHHTQREMEGSEEVSMKELNETVLFLVKQLAELKGELSKTASVSGYEAQRGAPQVWRPDLILESSCDSH